MKMDLPGKPEIIEQTIYGLCNPGTTDVLYVGRSKHAVERRRHHVQMGHVDFSPEGIWVKYLDKVGKWPNLTVLEKKQFTDVVEAEQWAKKQERTWIRNIFSSGVYIFNQEYWWKHPERNQISNSVRKSWQLLHEIYFRLDFWLSTESDGYIEITQFQAFRAIRAMVEEYPAIEIAPLDWLDTAR